jgi:hypothetical protein
MAAGRTGEQGERMAAGIKAVSMGASRHEAEIMEAGRSV